MGIRGFEKLLLLLLPLLGGCPVFQSQDTPVSEMKMVEPVTGQKYWLYVPSTYSEDRDWPLVVTLHGTIPWDTYTRQIEEWKDLAEKKGLIVVAPYLRSSQGVLPILGREDWYKDIALDERTVLAVMDDVCGKYRVDSHKVLMTSFSAGGFCLFHTGLRNPGRFSMLISRSSNSDVRMLEEQVTLTDAARQLPIVVYWGKQDPVMTRQGWDIFEYLRNHGFKKAKHEEVQGGHIRRPEIAYRAWLPIVEGKR